MISDMRLYLSLILLVVVSLPGCSSSEDQPEDSPRAVRLTPANEVGGLRSSDRAPKGQNACRSAKVMTGSNPSAIDFVVLCSGSKVDGVVFALQRYLPADLNKKEPIISYRRFPEVKGNGARSRYGKCDLEQEVLTCTAKISGPVRISGRLWVGSQRRCAVTVSVVSVSSSGCGMKEPCLGFVKTSGLFRGQPQGC